MDFSDDVFNGMIKSVVFAIVVTWIAVYQGYDLIPTSKESRATTKTVVYSLVGRAWIGFSDSDVWGV